MKKAGLFLLFLGSACCLSAQKVVVIQDPKIEQLVEDHRNANAKIGVIEGFRIQIFFNSGTHSRSNAEAVRLKFSSQYPHIPTYLTFKEPNFRVRVGDFRTRNEARGFLKQIAIDYPNAFVIKDEIKFPILKIENQNNSNE